MGKDMIFTLERRVNGKLMFFTSCAVIPSGGSLMYFSLSSSIAFCGKNFSLSHIKV